MHSSVLPLPLFVVMGVAAPAGALQEPRLAVGLNMLHELVRVDTQTGHAEVLAEVPFTGEFLESVDRLPGGDYLVAAGGNEIYRLDGDSFVAVHVGTVPGVAWIEGLAIAEDGTVYASVHSSSGHFANRLIVIDPDTADATPVGFFSTTNDMEGLAISGAGDLIGSSLAGTLYSIDRVTGFATALFNVPGHIGCLDFGQDGTLYANRWVDTSFPVTDSELLAIDLGSQSVSTVDIVGHDGGLVGLEMVPRFSSLPYGLGLDCPCGNGDSNAGCGNSTGSGALLWAAGSTSVAADDLALVVSGLPVDQFALLFMGTEQGWLPFGDGVLSVFGSVHRFNPPLSSGTMGEVEFGIGLVAASSAFGSGAITAGSSWNFQVWYRDPAGPCAGTFNTSNALDVTFGD